MLSLQKKPKIEDSMGLLETIYHRRSVREYTLEAVDKETLLALLDTAVHAPNSQREEPWSFVVIQDKILLSRLSESVKDQVRKDLKTSPQTKRVLDCANDPEYKVFHNVGTLIIICGKTQSSFAVADCWLAAGNLMLAASAMGLGSCVIGSAVTTLNTLDWKDELKIPGEMMAIAPIIVGIPAVETHRVLRKEPEILTWK